MGYIRAVKKHTEHWVTSSEYDLKVAHHLFKTRSYIYVVFMCHLSTEKLLKACVVEFTDRTYPPKIHILPRLAEIAGILAEIPSEFHPFLAELTEQQEKTRYAIEPSAFPKTYTRKYAESVLSRTKELQKWLKRRLTSTNLSKSSSTN